MRLSNAPLGCAAAFVAACGATATAGHAQPASNPDRARLERLVAAYPDALARIDGADLVWRDGTRMALYDGEGHKPFAAWLDHPSIADMLAKPYPAGAPLSAPAVDDDPGRARNRAFFHKLYGDCADRRAAPELADVAWLPAHGGKPVKFARRHGAAAALARVSARLDTLQPELIGDLLPPAGTYVCRPIAGTARASAHGWGIAIDIATTHAAYWQWDGRNGRTPTWRNAIPAPIVAAFEAEGFIWGGRWHHYDTMHFEYRPELAVPASR